MNGKKLLLYTVIALAIWMICTAPMAAAHLVRQGGSAVSHGANSGTQFVNGLTSGKP